MDRALLKLQTVRVDTHKQLNELFKNKVQLEEKIEDNEMQLHFHRGVVAALDLMETEINREKELLAKRDNQQDPSKGISFEGVAMDRPDFGRVFTESPSDTGEGMRGVTDG